MDKIIEFEPIIIQENRRWDWVKNTMEGVSEQPVVLFIFENNITVIFNY